VHDRLGLSDYVRANVRAAEVFQLPRTGQIAPGYSADLVVVDPGMTKAVDASTLGGTSDFSPFEGQTLTGWPVKTFLRGRLIAESGELVDADPSGRYLRSMHHQARRGAAQGGTA
jgi:dihydropyrimidinase